MRLLSAVFAVLAIINFVLSGVMLMLLHNALGWSNFIAGFCALVVAFVVLRSE